MQHRDKKSISDKAWATEYFPIPETSRISCPWHYLPCSCHTLCLTQMASIYLSFLSLQRGRHVLILLIVSVLTFLVLFCIVHIVLFSLLSIFFSFLHPSVSPSFTFNIISPPGFLQFVSFCRAGGDTALQFDKCMFSKHSNHLNQS